MKKIALLFTVFFIILPLHSQIGQDYLNESPEEIAQRMKWYTEAEYGMFIHFGLYSQLGGIYKGMKTDHYAEWIQCHADVPREEYSWLMTTWNPENYDADFIAQLAKKAGMKYIVITSKHHEGFCLWDSRYTEYDIASTPVKGRDFIRELSDACKKHGLRFGTYYSIIDWHHPAQFIGNVGETQWKKWGETKMHPEHKQIYVDYMKNQIEELVSNYNTDIMWFDGDWAEWWTLEDGKNLYQFIRELKPEIIINNRVAKRDEFKKDFGTPEQRHPDDSQNYYWEACYTMNGSWGYKSFDDNWKTPQTIYDKLKDITGKGGNLLLNIGPDGNGEVPEESVEILMEVGRMLEKENNE